MKYLHTMIRVLDLEETIRFFEVLGLSVIDRREYPAWECTLVFLATEKGAPEVELTYNWGNKKPYTGGRNFGHLAYEVENIYEKCQAFLDAGYQIARPPRDGRMAFIRTPDEISIELLQAGESLPAMEPWASMENHGEW